MAPSRCRHFGDGCTLPQNARAPLVTGAGADVPAEIERLIDRESDRLTGYRISPGHASLRALQAGPTALEPKIEALLRVRVGGTESARNSRAANGRCNPP